MRTLIFKDETDDEIWLEGNSLHEDSNILVTVTSLQGERSAYISGHSVTELQAGQLVEPAPEVESGKPTRSYSGTKRAMTISGYAIAIVVKGDANKTPDNQKPVPKDILGVVIFTIPFLGNILTPKALFLLVPCIFGLWLILDAMNNVE